jgi:hypothetical protein
MYSDFRDNTLDRRGQVETSSLLENLAAIDRATQAYTFDIALMLAVEYLDLVNKGAVCE